MCRIANTAYSQTITDMLLLGFYFLLRPGEYAYTSNVDASPFCFCDIHLLINNRRLDTLTATHLDLQRVNFIALEFTNQKNGGRGELVGAGTIRTPKLVPCQSPSITHHTFTTT
jgi:hypothetical protein